MNGGEEKIAELKVLGNVGDQIQDGPLGKALKSLANAVTEYINSGNYTVMADDMATYAMEASHLMIDLLEEMELVK